MGKIDPTKERERLTKLYAGMSELELLEVGMEPQELTEWARSALLVEIHRRGLEWRPEPTKTETVPEDQILMILGKYDNRQSAMVDRDFLARSGVKAYFLEQESEGTEENASEQTRSGTQLLVTAKDLALARQKLLGRDEWERAPAQASPHESSSKPLVVRRYMYMPQALVGKSKLENAGIECYVQADNVIRTGLVLDQGGIELVVRQQDLRDAEQVLAEAAPVADETGSAPSNKI